MVAIVATTSTTYAQYATDAIRFGNTNYGSSARFKGMGNAQIGVGGDMSSLSGNPAGLGLFTRSEFSFTPEFNNSTSKADYLNNRTSDSRTKLNVNQAGVVWYNPTFRPQGQNTNKGVLSTVFGISYSRNNDYTQQYNYGGNNTKNTMRDFFAEEANRNIDPVNGSLREVSLENYAYSDYLINKNTPTASGRFESTPFSNNSQNQSAIISGGTSELNFAGALNISNQLYIGASIGMVNVRYSRTASYTEKGKVSIYNDDPNDPNGIPVGYATPEDYSFNYTQNQETRGSGVNGKIGVIYRPVSNFRIGLNYQTPTWLYVEDQYTENLFTSLSGNAPVIGDGIYSPYNYNLRTPSKASVGASYVFGGQAILSADVDFIDYASTHFSADGGGMNDQTINDNAFIKKNYTSAVNYRVGGEYKINNFNIRAGYGLNGSPMKNDTDNIFDTQYYSGGLGYRLNEYYIDLAYQRVQSEERLSPYALNNGTQPVATIKNANNNVFLTFGVRF